MKISSPLSARSISRSSDARASSRSTMVMATSFLSDPVYSAEEGPDRRPRGTRIAVRLFTIRLITCPGRRDEGGWDGSEASRNTAMSTHDHVEATDNGKIKDPADWTTGD